MKLIRLQKTFVPKICELLSSCRTLQIPSITFNPEQDRSSSVLIFHYGIFVILFVYILFLVKCFESHYSNLRLRSSILDVLCCNLNMYATHTVTHAFAFTSTHHILPLRRVKYTTTWMLYITLMSNVSCSQTDLHFRLCRCQGVLSTLFHRLNIV